MAASSTKRRNVTPNDSDWHEWRAQTSVVLQQQTSILAALQQQLALHEEKEEAYQEKVSKFMLESSVARATVQVETKDVKIDFEKFVIENQENHKAMFSKLDYINNKVWLALGAVMVYSPLLSFLAYELYKHLTITTAR